MSEPKEPKAPKPGEENCEQPKRNAEPPKPSQVKVGEPGGNLRQRAEWFNRRSGGKS